MRMGSHTPICSPARRSLSTGRNEHEHGNPDEMDRLMTIEIGPEGSARRKVRSPARWEGCPDGCLSPDQALSRYPVLKIHATTASEIAKKAAVIPRLMPTLTSAIP